SFNDESGGSYVLTILPEPAPAALTFGQTVSAVVEAAGDRDLWTFEGVAGHAVTLISLPYDSELSLELDLYGTQGQLLVRTSSYDNETAFFPTISAFPLPDSGTYTVVVRRTSPFTSGAYRLTLTDLILTTPTPTLPPTLTPTSTLSPPPELRGSMTLDQTV